MEDLLEGIRRLNDQLSAAETGHLDLSLSVPQAPEDLVHLVERLNVILTSARRAKNQFLSMVSHEIRTPLGAIQGFADLLSQAPELPESCRPWVDVIQKNGVELTSLLNQMLDLSKIEAGQLLLESRRFDIRQTASEVLSLLGLKARDAGVELRLDTESLRDATLWTDPLKCRQILVNLVSNAIKFTERGNVSVALSDVDSADSLRVDVRDSGRGIPSDFRPHLFEVFNQARGPGLFRAGGSGLGLAVSRKLAEALGGSLELIETSPEGSHFRFEVPRRLASAETALSGPQAAPSRGGRRVLLADDSPDMRLLMTRYLADIDLNLTVVSDGHEAVERFREGPYDLVILDVEMPRMNGYEAARAIRSSGYQGPILAVTAYALKAEKDEAFASGCSEHMTKPLQRETFLQIVAGLLKS